MSFYRTEEPVKIEKWLVDTKKLLDATRVIAGVHVEMVKIQLLDNACTWWLVEDKHLIRSTTWDAFKESFYAKSFLKHHNRT